MCQWRATHKNFALQEKEAAAATTTAAGKTVTATTAAADDDADDDDDCVVCAPGAEAEAPQAVSAQVAPRKRTHAVSEAGSAMVCDDSNESEDEIIMPVKKAKIE